MRKSLNVLVIAPAYNTFVKGNVDALSRFVNNINVIVHHNYLSELSNLIPCGGYLDTVRLYTKQKLVDTKNMPPNVNVHVLSTLYFIPDGRNTFLGEKLTKLFIRYIKQNNIEFDIIHAHFTYPQGYVGVRLSEVFDVPVVITLHENSPHLGAILSRLRSHAVYTWRKADMLIRVNKRDIDTFLKYGVDANRIVYVPNGYDPKKFQHIPQKIAREYLNLNENTRVLFNLARLYPEKGHKYLISAMKLLLTKRADVHCYIGGIGPLKKQLTRQIKEMTLESYVTLLGYIPNNQLSYWMNAAELFVLPSLSEGNPTVMFEALGIGLPFIGTSVGGIPDIIISEEYGLLCPPADPKCLAEKILIGLDREWDREKIRDYARQFTWDNIARQVYQVYRRVLG